MNKLSDIQKALLSKLKVLIKILDDNKIPYALEGGSAIGALRHKGFVPWDDDLDIFIEEQYISKFKDAITKESGVTLRNYKNKTINPFFKVYFEDSFVMNGMQKSFLKIDVFVLYKERKFTWWQNLMRVMTVGYIDFKSYPPTRYIAMLFPFTKKWLQNRFIKIMNKAKVVNDNYGYIYDDLNVWNANKNTKYVYGKYVKSKFEDMTVLIPSRARETMFEKYGDIMIEPEKKDREVHGTKLL